MVFSVIIPVYHVEKYLQRCVESTINQTYKDIEIILVDDGGDDKCPAMCDQYAKADKRIKVIHKTNGGLSDARNAGLDIAKGDYVIFVDSDDYIESDTCQKFAQCINMSNPDIVIGSAAVEGGKCNLNHPIFTGTISGKEYLLKAYREKHAPMAVWLNVYRKDFLNQNHLRFKYGILHEDEQFTPRAFLLSQNVICLDYCFYHYIIRDNSITTQNDRRKNARDLYNTFVELKNIYEAIEVKELKKYLIDSLSEKYLGIFQSGKLYQYGRKYLHKKFVIQNAKRNKTRLKAMLYYISPQMYWQINYQLKKDK